MPVLRKKKDKSSGKKNQEKKKIVPCKQCAKPCKGEVLKVQEDFFHVKCFRCCLCACNLSEGGFFIKEGRYYCTSDYQDNFGTKCHGCGEFLEGEVVTALGNSYHKFCFICARCGSPLPPGEKVTYNGKDVLCDNCAELKDSYVPSTQKSTKSGPTVNGTANREPVKPKQAVSATIRCTKCSGQIEQGQALVALDKHWHVQCFKCTVCPKVLAGEYMGRDGLPYCEKDYHRLFGIKCNLCEAYITGKVLEAGDMKYHPSCAKCCRCGNHFAEGEDMFIQGSEIWHPDCSKGVFAFSPSKMKEHALAYDYNRNRPHSAMSESPSKRSSNSMSPQNPELCMSYLSPTQSDASALYPRPLHAAPDPPTTPHFHNPDLDNDEPDPNRYRGIFRARPRSAFEGLKPRLKAHKDVHLSEEVIKESKFSGASKPPPNMIAKIERPEWPGMPHPMFVQRRNKSRSLNDINDEEHVRQKLIEEEVEKVDSALGKEILRTELEKQEIQNLDPRSASRTPSANREPTVQTRFENSWVADNHVPGGRSSTLPLNMRYPNWETYKRAGSLPATARYSTSPYYSDHEACSEGYISNGYASSGEMSPRLAKMTEEQLRNLRISKGRSLPSMNHKRRTSSSPSPSSDKGNSISETPMIYPLEVLITTNYRIPKEVDRAHLELHLSEEDFHRAFRMTYEAFISMPKWKQANLKKEALLY